ncbi:uncharacterized protein BO80DRAFT_400140 [Aspergillus ibericus CBS 121593]|uniref:Protein kinase domain-containing protein n=1 Tax=Aspergillus ibericus CBS 121593 TaxID=1448316 RepID=A0A395HA24_9EURO|nr:hypothetical protein BO80DRAFT_400140 [Aspergillus ibericus CBS 121593]RAL04005.1 hypothetical protein BO80DRAFT_400140 [Aspergillus ibericus CBS 121593]
MEPYHYKSFPYCMNHTMTVQSHNPPPPLPKSELHRRTLPTYDVELPSPTELCLQNPPLSGSDGSDFISIKLLGTLQVGEHKRSQIYIVRCVDSSTSSGPPRDQDLVAKFYDPWFQDLRDDDHFSGADCDYTHECAAYLRLSDLQGTVLPKFFGSYTLRIQVGEQCRLVRLILLEHIDGPSMDKLQPETFTTEERQEIVQQIVDGECAIYDNMVRHEDMHPRNMVLTRSGSGRLRVVVIDLGKSTLGRSRNPAIPELEKEYFPGVAISPLLRWNIHYRYPDQYAEWIDWPWQPWLEAQYKHTEDTITDAQREKWPVYDWLRKDDKDDNEDDSEDTSSPE